MRLRLRKR